MPYLLEDLDVYILSEKISDREWESVILWPNFEKFGLGKQLTSSIDSISANIAEGYGRYFIRENINFCFYARGSLLETKSWIRKARARRLIDDNQFIQLMSDLEEIHRRLNGYIKALKQNIVKQK